MSFSTVAQSPAFDADTHDRTTDSGDGVEVSVRTTMVTITATTSAAAPPSTQPKAPVRRAGCG